MEHAAQLSTQCAAKGERIANLDLDGNSPTTADEWQNLAMERLRENTKADGAPKSTAD